jgi:Tol biopolymer transport system component
MISTDGAVKKEVFGPSESAGWGSFLPDERSIIITEKQNGVYRTYLFDTTTEERKKIMDGSNGADWYLNSYSSPDGGRLLVRLAYQEPCCHTTLYVMDIDGSRRMLLADYAPWQVTGSFTADEQYIVFDSNREGTRSIYVADADGRNIRKLVDGRNPHVASGKPGGMYIRSTPYPTATPTTAAETAE